MQVAVLICCHLHGEFSIWRYLKPGPSVAAEGLNQKPEIQSGDEKSDRIAEVFESPRVDELAHLAAITGECNQREYGKAKLQAENHLAQNDQLARAACSIQNRDDYGWNDRYGSRDEAPQPWCKPEIEKSFHHHLAGERASNGRVLPGS